MFRSIRTENLKKGKIEKEEESANEKKKKHVQLITWSVRNDEGIYVQPYQEVLKIQD